MSDQHLQLGCQILLGPGGDIGLIIQVTAELTKSIRGGNCAHNVVDVQDYPLITLLVPDTDVSKIGQPGLETLAKLISKHGRFPDLMVAIEADIYSKIQQRPAAIVSTDFAAPPDPAPNAPVVKWVGLLQTEDCTEFDTVVQQWIGDHIRKAGAPDGL